MGNTFLFIVYTSLVSFAVLFGRISARIKLLVARSIWPSSNRPNQTSSKSSAIGLRPTDQPAKLVLTGRAFDHPLGLIRVGRRAESTSAGNPNLRVCPGTFALKRCRLHPGSASPELRVAARN